MQPGELMDSPKSVPFLPNISTTEETLEPMGEEQGNVESKSLD